MSLPSIITNAGTAADEVPEEPAEVEAVLTVAADNLEAALAARVTHTF